MPPSKPWPTPQPARPSVSAPSKSLPLLVPLVEEGWVDHPVTAQVIEIYLNELRAEAAQKGFDPDTLVLGCTHYPLLRRAFEKAVRPGTVVIDSAEAAAEAAVQLVSGRRSAFVDALPPLPRSAQLQMFRHRLSRKIRAPRLPLPRPPCRPRPPRRPWRLAQEPGFASIPQLHCRRGWKALTLCERAASASRIAGA